MVDFDGPIFSYRFDGSEPGGTYTWLAAFVDPISGAVLGVISQAEFTLSN